MPGGTKKHHNTYQNNVFRPRFESSTSRAQVRRVAAWFVSLIFISCLQLFLRFLDHYIRSHAIDFPFKNSKIKLTASDTFMFRPIYVQIFITVRQLRVCWCEAFSLKRRRVCRLQLLLDLASAVFLESESLGSHDHILLSQIWDFPFRRLLRLAGLGWKYSTRPAHGIIILKIKIKATLRLAVYHQSVRLGESTAPSSLYIAAARTT
jgi:hypothetical protein